MPDNTTSINTNINPFTVGSMWTSPQPNLATQDALSFFPNRVRYNFSLDGFNTNSVTNTLNSNTPKTDKFIDLLGKIPQLKPWVTAAGVVAGGIKTGAEFINDLTGRRPTSYKIDADTQLYMGASYTGSYDLMNTALNKSKNKYGIFDGNARERANRIINQAKELEAAIKNINAINLDYMSMANNLLNAVNYVNKINGGLDFRYARAAKLGMKLDLLSRIKNLNISKVINLNTKLIEDAKQEAEFKPVISVDKFKTGGIIEEDFLPIITKAPKLQNGGKASFESWFDSIPENYRNTNYDYKKAYEVLSLEELQKHALDPLNNHLRSVSPIIEENGNIPFLKLGTLENNPELLGEFDFYYKTPEGKEWSKKYDLLYINDRYYYVPKKLKQGGVIEKEELVKLEKTNQKNIIPEGALHKNKHHIENTEGLTSKGIPVVDNDGEQLAEIELNEIIFTLEVTKKLEKLYELYKNGESKDLAAIEAGKLLVQEILYNTDDRTNLVDKCLKGGKL